MRPISVLITTEYCIPTSPRLVPLVVGIVYGMDNRPRKIVQIGRWRPASWRSHNRAILTRSGVNQPYARILGRRSHLRDMNWPAQ